MMNQRQWKNEYFCKISRQMESPQCQHASCQADPLVRCSDDDLIDWAISCSDRGMRLNAEIALRKRHPSRVKVKRARTEQE